MIENADKRFTRWVNNGEGSRLGVPEEWLGNQCGRLFGPDSIKQNLYGKVLPPLNGKMVVEIPMDDESI